MSWYHLRLSTDPVISMWVIRSWGHQLMSVAKIIDDILLLQTTDLERLKTIPVDTSRKEIKDLDSQLKWADAFILVYSVTDKCSFDECNRLKFLINYHKRRRKLSNKVTIWWSFNFTILNTIIFYLQEPHLLEVPVVLVANKADQCEDRMVTLEEGYRRSKEISCVSFHEISVRENVDDVTVVFRDLTRYWRLLNKSPKLKRSTSDSHEVLTSPDMIGSYHMNSTSFMNAMASSPNSHSNSFTVPGSSSRPEKRMSVMFFGRLWAESSPDEADELEDLDGHHQRFRDRASTEGTLLNRPRRWKFPPPNHIHSRVERRMSISMRGCNNNSSY